MNNRLPDDEIFFKALELEHADQQCALIESLCSHDREQVQRVQSLLESHRDVADQKSRNPSILDRPELVFRSFSEATELVPGKRIGNYILKQLIGEGATSFVFLAKQVTPVDRDVALKLLKPGMDSQRILARFGLEHHVINQLEHPGITSVYDVGIQDNGRPFIAMELVPNALTITQYASQFCLDIGRRIELMIATCEIVQHAHQRGVIHRDLKPSNILIEGIAHSQPNPRIIDFGIAKVIQPCEGFRNVTTIGDRLGTPAYMSPEQALMPASNVDIRSDVYSLGAILYELLTGFTPRNASLKAATHTNWTSNAFWEFENKAPSRVNKLLTAPQTHQSFFLRLFHAQQAPKIEKATSRTSNELDWITLKAIAKDRQDRYQTVADLQRDLQRFIQGEPVDAAGLSFMYRLKKLIRRNRAISTAAAVTLLTILTTSIMTISYAVRAHDSQRQALLQLQNTLDAQKKLVLERDRAEEAVRQTQAVLRAFQVQWVTHRALSRFLNQSLEDALQDPSSQYAASDMEFQFDAEALTKPHDRLIVRGDWTWATSTFPVELINTAFQISSIEASKSLSFMNQSLPSSQPTEPPIQLPASQPMEPLNQFPASQLKVIITQELGIQPSPLPEQPPSQSLDPIESSFENSPRTGEERQSFQDILLEEIKSTLPAKDPFIAEILDNCGLLALEKNSPADAAKHLSESVRIWEQNNKYADRLLQAQIFLAEAFLKSKQQDKYEEILLDIDQSLAKTATHLPPFPALRELLHQIKRRSRMGP